MSPGLQQASRLMSLPPGSTTIVWIRDPRPVVIPPEQDAIVIFPGRPSVPATVLETFPLIVCAHPDLIRMSPACWLFDATTTEAPRSMTTVQLVLISIPGARPDTCDVVTIAGDLICTRREPTSKIAFQASAVEPVLSYVKNAHRSASPVHVGGLLLKFTVTLWSTSTSGWLPHEEQPVKGPGVGVGVAGTGVAVLVGVVVFVGVRVGVFVLVGVAVLV